MRGLRKLYRLCSPCFCCGTLFGKEGKGGGKHPPPAGGTLFAKEGKGGGKGEGDHPARLGTPPGEGN